MSITSLLLWTPTATRRLHCGSNPAFLSSIQSLSSSDRRHCYGLQPRRAVYRRLHPQGLGDHCDMDGYYDEDAPCSRGGNPPGHHHDGGKRPKNPYSSAPYDQSGGHSGGSTAGQRHVYVCGRLIPSWGAYLNVAATDASAPSYDQSFT